MKGIFQFTAYASVFFSASLICQQALAAEDIKGDATSGKATFDTICSHCHETTYEDSRIGAPGLQGVLERHDEAWLNQWIKGPENFAKVDETAKDLIESNKFGLAMPTLPAMMDDQKRADVIEYLKTLK